MDSNTLEAILRPSEDRDRMVPGFRLREFPEPEEISPLLRLADVATKNPYVWGVAGGLVPLADFVLNGLPHVPIELREFGTFVLKTFSWPVLGLLGSAAVHDVLGYLKGTVYPKVPLAIFSETESISSGQSDILTHFNTAEKSSKKGDLEGVIGGCTATVRGMQRLGTLGRLRERFTQNTVWTTLRDKYLYRAGTKPKDVQSRLLLAASQVVLGSDENALDTIEGIATLYRKGHMNDDIIDVFSYLASVSRAVGNQSRNHRRQAKSWENWFWEQAYFEASYASTDEIRFGESKNPVYSYKSFKDDIIIKELSTREEAVDAVKVNERKREIIKGKNEYVPLQPVVLFPMVAEGKEKMVSIWRMLPGETFYQKIRTKDPQVGKYKDRILEMVGLLHAGLDPDEFGLKERDYASYIRKWADKAEVDGVFENGELFGYYNPIVMSFSWNPSVFSLDPHPMNFQVLDDGRVANLDDEATRKIPVQGDLVKLIELFPYDEHYLSEPGSPDYAPFVEDISRYASVFGDVDVHSKEFLLGYWNAVIDLGLSLYSPYSVRTSMGGFKKHLLEKTEKAIGLIESNFSLFYSENQREYKGLLEVTHRMFRRNGFDK